MARGWRIFGTIAGGGFAVFFASVPFWGFDQVANWGAFAALTAFLLGWAVFFACAVAALFKERVEVHADRVRKVGLFRRHELAITNITGFRLLQGSVSSVLLMAKTPPPKHVKIDLVVERKAEFLQWVAQHFPNLDAVEFETEVEEVRADASLGSSEEQRLVALRRARRAVGVYNGAVAAAAIWGLFMPRPYGWAMGALALLPLAAFGLLWRYRGVVQLDGKESGARPKVAYGLIGPAGVLAARAALDWHILAWSNLWAPCLIATAGLVAPLFMFAPDLRRQRATAILYVVFALVYAYGLVVHLNCYHDRSPAAVHPTKVIAATISSGKSTTYYLTVHPWVEGTEPEKISVPQVVYERHPVGSAAQIVVRRGALRIPWYQLR